MRLILGSGSPRRREILSMYNIPFEVAISNFDERSTSLALPPKEYVRTISEEKGKALLSNYPTTPILTGDTTVYQDKRYFNKPEDEEEAFNMLKQLSKAPHEIYTAVTLTHENIQTTHVVSTKIKLRPLSDSQIKAYIHSFTPFDKAGAYGIQDGYGILIDKIDGNITDVIGLPLEPLEKLLTQIGYEPWSAFS
jgi:septum formation protein